MKFYQMSVEQVIQELKTDLKNGLTKSDAKKRIHKYGENLISEQKPINPFIIFLKQFINPLMLILLFATIVCILITEIKDAIIISIAMVMNIIIGFIQEFRAEKAIQKLKKLEVSHCTVKRDGKTTIIETKNLVPGDIVLLSAGSRIPADIRLTYLVDFNVDEASLTGESKPIRKNVQEIKEDLTVGDRLNMAFAGTIVLSGKGEGLVTNTGVETYLGQIAQLVTKTKQEHTPLQNKIKNLSWILGILFLGTSTLITLIGLLKGFAFTKILIIGIALAVASIPEGLLIAVTVILAIGMQRMLKRHALVRHLIAAETLGSVSVICTDKTGTLTKGHMQVVQIFTPNFDIKIPEVGNVIELNDEVKNLIINSILNNDAQLENKTNKTLGNPTDIALIQNAHDTKFNISEFREKYTRIDEIPFSSDIKYMVTVHKADGQQKLIIKGAPEKVFNLCEQDPSLEKIKLKTEEMVRSGLRVIAVAEKTSHQINLRDHLNNLSLVGLFGIQDPLRSSAKATVAELKKAGIHVVLVTGDHKDTAFHVAKQANIIHKKGKIISGQELDNMSDEELTKDIEHIDIFARVEPKHKIRIVHAWQNRGHPVAMIGDGINDAPALKAADIGVALGSGSDVAHEISDMVLLDNNLSSIDAAVKEGRRIFDNIRKTITFLLSDCFGEVLLIGICIVAGLPLPILAPQILWINLISDGLPYLTFTMEPEEAEIMHEPPRKKDEPILNKEIKIIIFGVGIILDLIIVTTYIFLLNANYDIAHLRTIIFTALAINSLFFALPLKSFRKSIFRINIFSNLWLIGAIIISIGMQLAVIYFYPLQILFNTIALNLLDWLIILPLVLTKSIAIEITKFLFSYGKNSKTNPKKKLIRKNN